VAEATDGRLNVSSVRNALWLPDEGRIHPLTLLAHLARQARAAGVQFAGQARVVAYEEQGHQWRLMLADGTKLEARGLISAVGPTARPNARIYALAFAIDLPDTFPDFWDASPYTYTDFRAGNGRIGASGGRYGKAGVTRHDVSNHKRMAGAAQHWLPELAGKEPLFTWAVDLAVSVDMIPELRPLGKDAPGFAIEGLGALGVLPGTFLGRRAGEAVARCLNT
jgi:glycine/D-amino acid oxidase-like deaminating enzyme